MVLVRKDRFAFCRPIRRHHKGAEQHEQKCGRLIPCEDIHADENRRDRCHNRLQVHVDAHDRSTHRAHADGNQCVGCNGAKDDQKGDLKQTDVKIRRRPQKFMLLLTA